MKRDGLTYPSTAHSSLSGLAIAREKSRLASELASAQEALSTECARAAAAEAACASARSMLDAERRRASEQREQLEARHSTLEWQLAAAHRLHEASSAQAAALAAELEAARAGAPGAAPSPSFLAARQAEMDRLREEVAEARVCTRCVLASVHSCACEHATSAHSLIRERTCKLLLCDMPVSPSLRIRGLRRRRRCTRQRRRRPP